MGEHERGGEREREREREQLNVRWETLQETRRDKDGNCYMDIKNTKCLGFRVFPMLTELRLFEALLHVDIL